MNGVTHATFEEARAIVLRHGYNANACVTLMPPPFSFFTTPVVEGVIAYQQFGRILLCGGDPICAESDIVPLTAAFQQAARRARLTIVFLPATPRAATLLTQRLCFDAVKIGEDNFYDLRTWDVRGQKMKHIRANVNRAQREGVTVRRCAPHAVTDDMRAQVTQLTDTWLRTRGIGALSFLLGVHPFDLMDDRRLFLACQGAKIVGYLACSPIPARNGWYLEDLIRSADAPAGVTELLFHEAVRELRSEGGAYATLGMAALADCGAADQPSGHRIAGWLFEKLFTGLDSLYSFQSLRFYKEKFGPAITEDMFALWWPRRRCFPCLLVAVVRALYPGSIFSTLLRFVLPFSSHNPRRTAE